MLMSVTDRRTFLSWLSKSGLVLAAAGTTLAGRTAAAAADRRDVLVFTNATLIDGTGAPPRPDTTIVVAGQRILAVGQHGVAPPDGVRVVNLRGKYVLPGLWDLHTHTVDFEKILLPLYIANGVTSTREMWGVPFVHDVRRRIAEGDLLGPRMVVGDLIDGPNSWLVNLWGNNKPSQVGTEAEARAAVREAKRNGADFIKVYSLLRDDTLAAVASEARRLHLPIAGHSPDTISVVRSSALGMRTQEHLYGLYVDVSRDRDDIRRVIENTPIDPAHPFHYFFKMRDLERQAIKAYDRRRAADMFAALVRNGTFLTPTLTVLKIFTFPPDQIRDPSRAKYVPQWLLDGRWALGDTPPPDVLEANRQFFEASAQLVRDAVEAGVTMVAGTDGGFLAPWVLAGFCTHDELELMVRIGLTPMQAILAATRDAARTVGLDHVSGTVSPGKFADLLVLDANPLTDIRNTQRIHAIVANGRFINRAERERMLADVVAEARRTPPPATTGLQQLGSCCTPPLHLAPSHR
jgi:imidazolonepropionase-like amidohydrolase